MIIGVGIDTIEIERFSSWHHFSDIQLQRIFTKQEIQYCRNSSSLSAQRFAARFATREAFFKAWVSAYPKQYYPFLTICRSVSIAQGAHNEPKLHVNWDILGLKQPWCHTLISLTHTHHLATAIVMLQNY